MTFLAFKGGHSYELQLGKLVLQVRHKGGLDPMWLGKIRRINVFIDPFGSWR